VNEEGRPERVSLAVIPVLHGVIPAACQQDVFLSGMINDGKHAGSMSIHLVTAVPVTSPVIIIIIIIHHHSTCFCSTRYDKRRKSATKIPVKRSAKISCDAEKRYNKRKLTVNTG